MKAGKGTLFFPFSQLPPKKARHDCFYHHPPAMLAPPSLQNLHACEVCQNFYFFYVFILLYHPWQTGGSNRIWASQK